MPSYISLSVLISLEKLSGLIGITSVVVDVRTNDDDLQQLRTVMLVHDAFDLSFVP